MRACGDETKFFGGRTCILKPRHRDVEHTDGLVKWVHFCEMCEATIRSAGRCKRCIAGALPALVRDV